MGNRLGCKIDDANGHVYSYDVLYQLIKVDYNDGNVTGYGYDSLGNRTDVNETGSTTSYSHNSLNQYTSVDSVAYTYDDNGNLTSDGARTYSYDCENRLTAVSTGAEQTDCGDFSCSSDWQVGDYWAIAGGDATFNGVEAESGWLEQDVNVVAGQYYTVSFEITYWNSDDTPTFEVSIGGVGIFDEGSYTTNKVYTFENIKAVSTGKLRFYAESCDMPYNYFDITIDNVTVKQEDVAFKYDYLGRRAAKTYGGVTTTYCYDGDQVIAEYESTTLKRKFIYGPGIDEPILMIDVADSNKKYYYHFDGLGSVIALSDSNGSIVERYSYDVFGDPNRSSDVNNPYLFTGRRYDDQTGLYYYRARCYNADVGRFMSSDPIMYRGGFNLYAYVLNDPVNYIDPYGESWSKIIWCAICAAQQRKAARKCAGGQCVHVCDDVCHDYEKYAECMATKRKRCIKNCINKIAATLKSCVRCATKIP